MTEFRYLSRSEADTEKLGHLLAQVLCPSTVVGLVGTLGAGKTRLVQAIAAGLGVARDVVTSPTFVLVNEYPGGRVPVYHFDTYRIRDRDEFCELGPEEYFQSSGITLVEWAERFADCLPADRLTITIVAAGPTVREFRVAAETEKHQGVVDTLNAGRNS
jgi:tRNA threonylcarbamoyladenosine biosynthesis protein TsaE